MNECEDEKSKPSKAGVAAPLYLSRGTSCKLSRLSAGARMGVGAGPPEATETGVKQPGKHGFRHRRPWLARPNQGVPLSGAVRAMLKRGRKAPECLETW